MLVANCSNSQDVFDAKKHDKVDPEYNLSRDDYRDMYNQHPGELNQGPLTGGATASEPPIPDMAEILAAPKPPKIGETQLVSVAVTDDVPLKDVLVELARLADVDIEVDSGITGGITFRAKDRPFNEVIERISDLAGLRYNMKNNVLRVERDTPFIQIYSIDFLNMERTSTSSINISTNVLSSGGGTSGGSGGSGGGGGGGGGGGSSGSDSGGLNSGSSTSVTSKSDSDFWGQFEGTIGQILAYTPENRTSSTSAAQPTPGAPPSVAAAAAGGAKGGGGAAAGRGGKAPAAAAAGAVAQGGDKPFYILNRQAATLTISGNEKQHEMIARFLEKIRNNATSQVLIEAKIVEVTLNDDFQAGINWSKLGNDKVSFPLQFNADVGSGAQAINSTNVATFSFNQSSLTGANIDLDVAVQLAQLFGTTRTLSSPRLHAINNQEAVLTFAENQVYFTLQVSQQNTPNTAGNTTSNIQVNSTVHTVPIGIIMTLQPSINTDTNEVTLSVRPTLSRVTGQVPDPAIAYLLTQLPAGANTAALQSNIPIVEVRELDSILKLKSGQVMVIGGLMTDEGVHNQRGLPYLSEVPYLGNLFKGTDQQHDASELVIFIRATIIGSGSNFSKADRTLYEKFTRDPRPLEF